MRKMFSFITFVPRRLCAIAVFCVNSKGFFQQGEELLPPSISLRRTMGSRRNNHHTFLFTVESCAAAFPVQRGLPESINRGRSGLRSLRRSGGRCSRRTRSDAVLQRASSRIRVSN